MESFLVKHSPHKQETCRKNGTSFLANFLSFTGWSVCLAWKMHGELRSNYICTFFHPHFSLLFLLHGS